MNQRKPDAQPRSTSNNEAQEIGSVASSLGNLPPKVHYFDEYEEKRRSLEPDADVWPVTANGRTIRLDFRTTGPRTALILKHFAMYRLHSNAVSGARYTYDLISTFEIQSPLLDAACRDPYEAIEFLRTEYTAAASSVSNSGYFGAGKALLNFFCEFGLGSWQDGHANILRTISSPVRRAKHRTVRDGSAIMSFEEERCIVAFLDELSAEVAAGGADQISTQSVRDACILVWNFQHAMRPIQIANRNANHVRLRRSNEGKPIVHVTFRYAKQRPNAKVKEQTRKLKRDWAPLMEAWLKRRDGIDREADFDRPESLFGVPPQEITQIIACLTVGITGVRRVPYDLRHSAAQRKADAGCSRLELAEFLMHSDIDTADAYIEMSPTQAEKINSALGLSPLFQAIDQALKNRSVNIGELLIMPADQQIGAAPHGHIIAGIGGCALGQSVCPKTPALACYDCHKFMYLRAPEVHRAARDSVRAIIQEFIEAGPTDRTSPAFLQLRRVIETIEAIIEDLEADEEDKA